MSFTVLLVQSTNKKDKLLTKISFKEKVWVLIVQFLSYGAVLGLNIL
jgi:hypothetical protein